MHARGHKELPSEQPLEPLHRLQPPRCMFIGECASARVPQPNVMLRRGIDVFVCWKSNYCFNVLGAN